MELGSGVQAKHQSAQYMWKRGHSFRCCRTPHPLTQLMGLFEPGHMKYEAHRDPEQDPTLMEMTEAALCLLGRTHVASHCSWVGAASTMAIIRAGLTWR